MGKIIYRKRTSALEGMTIWFSSPIDKLEVSELKDWLLKRK